jgi:hypothetical protein
VSDALALKFALQFRRDHRSEVDRHIAQLERELERLPTLRPASSSRRAVKAPGFEIHHNGKQVGRAGLPGFGRLDAIVGWFKRPAKPRFPTPLSQLSLSLSASDSNGTDSTGAPWEQDTHLRWNMPRIKVGDTIRVRAIKSGKLDEPANAFRPLGKEPTVEQELKHRLSSCRRERTKLDRQIAQLERRLKRLRTRGSHP